jgi:hypothetical protein
LAAHVEDLVAYPWTGQKDQDVLALARKHGRAAWVRVGRVKPVSRSPRNQDAVEMEIAVLAVFATTSPGIGAVAGRGATAFEKVEQLSWEIRDQLRDCPLRDWLTGRGIEFERQTVLYQDETAVAVELLFSAAGHVGSFAADQAGGDPLPARTQIQYSADGETWVAAYDSSSHLYLRVSLDYGATWGERLRVVGPAGADAITSVASLPASPLPTTIYRLAASDGEALAAPGLYRHAGGTWQCLVPDAAYELGELSGAVTLPAILNATYTATTVGAVAWTLPSAGGPGRISLRLTNGGSAEQTWDGSVNWPGGIAPALSATGTDWLVFVTAGGNEWDGSLAMGDVR